MNNPVPEHRGLPSYTKLKPLFDAVAEPYAQLNVDMGDAGDVLLNVADALDDPKRKLREVLSSLPSATFDTTIPLRIRDYGWSLKYIEHARGTAALQQATTKVPDAVAQPARIIRNRMFKVVEYHLGDLPEYAKQVVAIREGTGYEDLADDLARLAVLFHQAHDRVSHDPKHYVATDRDDAMAYYETINTLLRKPPTDPWGVPAAQAWTLISAEYKDLRDTVEWLWRRDAATRALFPTAYVRKVARSGPMAPAVVPPAGVPPVGGGTSGSTPS
jgi:hypothetical protein